MFENLLGPKSCEKCHHFRVYTTSDTRKVDMQTKQLAGSATEGYFCTEGHYRGLKPQELPNLIPCPRYIKKYRTPDGT